MNLFKNNSNCYFQNTIITMILILSCSPTSHIQIDGQLYDQIMVKSMIGVFTIKAFDGAVKHVDLSRTLSINEGDQEFKEFTYVTGTLLFRY
jgi:hypothetical protein